MKTIELLCTGELKFKGLQELENKYLQNINYYVKFSIKKIKEIKHKEESFVREKESAMFLKEIKDKDYVDRPGRKGAKKWTRGNLPNSWSKRYPTTRGAWFF